MGVLKVRVGGAWQSLGSAGGPLPAGGVLGDILVKQSSALSDALWSTTMPKLALTSTAPLALTSTNHPLTISSPAGYNLALSTTQIQARNSNSVTTMQLNPLGGLVNIGVTDASVYPPGLQITESIHATSRRAQIQIGSGWQIGQDYSANGTKDLYVYSSVNARVPLSINAGGTQVVLAGLTIGTHPSHNAPGLWTGGYTPGVTYRFLAFGNDTYVNADGGLAELRVDNATYVRCGTPADVVLLPKGNLFLGPTPVKIQGSSQQLYMMGGSNTYIDTDTMHFRTAAGVEMGYMQNGVHFTTGYITSNGGFRSGASWMLVASSDTDTGVRWEADGQFSLMTNNLSRISLSANVWIKNDTYTTGNKNWAGAQIVAQNGGAAANVSMAALALNPSQSGVAPLWLCNGVSGEILVANNNPCTAYIPIIASAFNVGSSLRFKTDVNELDDRGVLDRVRGVKLIRYRERIRPQNTFGPGESHDHDCDIDPCDGTSDDPCCIALNDKERLGVSAEALWELLPEAVYLGPDREPETVNVGTVATLALAGVAALLRRIEQLEGKPV